MASVIKVAELFAGVGGFRLGLEGYRDAAANGPEFHLPAAGPFKTVWANQWEPGTDRKQFATRCYKKRFGEDSVDNEDIHIALDRHEAGELDIPDVDMVVGGFPCQDYSVARPLSQAQGIEGKKGVLWWEIYRFLQLKSPRYGLFENVDRLLKSPASQRGRDFAIILSCLASLGYAVEWRVLNAAEYGFPQRRRRVYIFAERLDNDTSWDPGQRLSGGVMAEAFPIDPSFSTRSVELLADPVENSEKFGLGLKTSPFENAGVMCGGHVATARVTPRYDGPHSLLRDVLVPDSNVPESFYVPADRIPDWEYLKGSKRERRVNKKTGFEYYYSEGSMAFPDPVDRPSRTLLTGEGGVSPSRFKHVVRASDGRLRRLVPDELDRLQGFPAGWTATGMTDAQRAFCMGNALVVGIPHRIGLALARRLRG